METSPDESKRLAGFPNTGLRQFASFAEAARPIVTAEFIQSEQERMRAEKATELSIEPDDFTHAIIPH